METGVLIAIIIISIIVIVLIILLVMWLIARSKGKITIYLDNYNYSPGDTISGKIGLTIKKPVQSKALTVRIIGEYIKRDYTRNSSSYQRVFDFKQPVEGAKDYQPGPELNYDFKIKIPQNLVNSPQLTGVLGAIESLSVMNTMVKWYLIADLDIPGIDISKKVQINIG